MGNVRIGICAPSQLDKAFEVRRRVFVEEQNVPETLELDEFDHHPETVHWIAWDADGAAVGTARMRPYSASATGKVERVAVLASHRGVGIGKLLMMAVEAEARSRGYRELRLNAQCHAQRFYEQMGYISEGFPFEEAGIPHIAMQKPLSS
ncbi:GNAT family N-acetyltransferase [Alicyclobacillus contaminans]|uniref:GNAT family N-acetyltransferase n=1 Tax=Alicyclobacillus contaminans TaxID=392016 RepID=UPI00042400BE|nr:GNAT family N-acetyltransferase [Alicyclobacillus contaminans]GMA49825.1 GNAT family N-acetyltransferase [Alicyclobacillus contaminans]